MNSFVEDVSLTETPLFVVPYNILDSAEQEHATIRWIVLFWVSFLNMDFMLTAIKPIWEFNDISEDLSCGFAGLVVAFVFGYAIVDDDFLVHDSGKEPMVAVIYCDNDLVLFADVFSFEGSWDHLLGFGKSGFGEKWVEHFVFFAGLSGLVVDHFKVSINDFVVEPDPKREGSKGSGKEFL